MQKRGSAGDRRVVFVVIGRNEGERLKACLHSLSAITKQIVYSDSASSDGSPQLAHALGAIVVSIASSPLNAARGRNEGFEAALAYYPHCEFVQFLDGDCILQTEWVKVATAFFDSNPSVAVVCGRRFEAFPEASIYNRLADFEWNTPAGQAKACGGDAMMRIAAVRSVGGFDSELMAGEEPELCARLRSHGWEIWRLDALMTEHDAAIFRFSQWWRRTIRSGFGYTQAWLKTRSTPEPLNVSQLRSALFWVVLLPSTLVVGALLLATAKLLFLIPASYAVQIIRIAARRHGSWSFRLVSGALLMVAKLAEVTGIARCLMSTSYRTPIEYKPPPA